MSINPKTKTKTKRIILYSLGLVVFVLILIGLIKLGSVFGFLIIFPWFVHKLEESGMNIWLARALMVPFVVLILFVIGWLFSFKAERRRRGLIVGGCILIVWFLLRYSLL